MKIAILRNEDPSSGLKWEIACQQANIAYEVIDLTCSSWMHDICKEKYDFFLLRPSGFLSHYKNLYDERLYIISKVLGNVTYPSYEECYIYENKKLLSYFLQATGIPHPKTYVFYSKQEAADFVKWSEFPLVAKTSIGASGSGVKIIKTKQEAQKYINRAFSTKGIKRRFGPNRVIGTPSKWFIKALKDPSYFFKKVKEYFSIYKHGERDFLMFQEYIPHDYEWRAVRIGECYFAHKKIKLGEKASGSKGIEYLDPPKSILNFTKELCEKHNFHFMAVDLFDDGKGGFLVNELQTIFGHVQDYILAVNDKPGRYIFHDGRWEFEEGDFNVNESYNLRLKTAIDLYDARR